MENQKEVSLVCDVDYIRLDKFIALKRILTRSQFKLRFVSAKVNGKDASLSKKLLLNDKVSIIIKDEKKVRFEPEDIKIDIIFENSNILVVDKKEGMVVHPGAGNTQSTLLNAILSHIKKDEFKIPQRAGIVHRLDKDTSGVIMVAKNLSTLEFLQRQFKERETKKVYLAIAKGKLKFTEGKIEGLITRDRLNRKRFTLSDEGKHSLTYYKVLEYKDGLSLVMLFPYTGRTHQLRVHLKSQNAPILGDSIYLKKENCGLMLHAYSLNINISENENMTFKSPVPNRFKTYFDFEKFDLDELAKSSIQKGHSKES